MPGNKKPKRKFTGGKVGPNAKTIFDLPLTAVEKQKLSLPPQESLKAFIEDRATIDDWYIVAYRIYTGLKLAGEQYSEETVLAIFDIKEKVFKMFDKYKHLEDGSVWIATEDEKNDFKHCLETIDQMQEDARRSALYRAYVATKKYMEQFEEQVVCQA